MDSRPCFRISLLVLILTAVSVFGEMLESKDQAMLVITGRVRSVSKTRVLSLDDVRSDYATAIEVQSIDRGERVQPGDVVQVRYFHRTYVPFGPLAVTVIVPVAGFLIWRWWGRASTIGVRRAARVGTVVVGLLVLAVAWVFSIGQVPGMWGHHDFPSEGQRIRAYLSRMEDGSYVAVYPQWIDWLDHQ